MIYLKYLQMHLKSSMQYRASLAFIAFARFLTSFGSFLGIVFLFERFGGIKGWSFGEAALCFGVAGTAFSLAECFMRGFDTFQGIITSGDFDRLMLRPRGTILQVMGSRFELNNIGRIAQNAIVLAVGAGMVEGWTYLKALTLAFMLLSGIAVFSGLMILGATVCFWTVKGLEFINIFTDGGREVASYPLTIYQKWFARIFTFGIPFASFNYLPLLYVTGRSMESLYMLSPAIGIVFLLPCVLIWRVGLGHYASTGS